LLGDGLDISNPAGYALTGYHLSKGTQRVENSGLRVRREMLPNMVLFTVESGIYFMDGMLEVARFTNFDKVKEHRKVGSVRIEDNIGINETGHDNPDVNELEAIRAVAYR
ncbi:hypothetical protein IWW50_006788, partial [Coemansia erecta]